MTKVRRTKQVIDAIGCKYLSFFNGGGYWYFVYDTLDDPTVPPVYETHSVYTNRLGSLTLEQWVSEGKQLVDRVTM